jgi:thiamine-monophosphate kinase
VQRHCALAGGDDYELLFTAPAARRAEIEGAGREAGVALTRIGEIRAGTGFAVLDATGANVETPFSAYDHFAERINE